MNAPGGRYDSPSRPFLHRRDGTTTFDHLITTVLGPSLVTTAGHVRARSMLIVGEVLCRHPAAVDDAAKLHSYAEFLLDRIDSSRVSLEGSLVGLRGLVQRYRDPSLTHLVFEDAKAIAVKLLTQVHLQSIAYAPRVAGFELLLVLIRGYGKALIQDGVDVFDGSITAVDQQKDPRCLLLATQVVEALAELPAEVLPGADSDAVREMHETLTIYFPVRFHPLPGQELTRQEVVTAVERALTALPGFRGHLVPWILQKLAERQDPCDCLQLLATCVERFGAGPDEMGQHEDALWAAVKHEIMAGAREGLSASERSSTAAGIAVGTLSRCIRAGMRSFASRALNEPVIATEMADILQQAGHWEYESPDKVGRKLGAACSLLRALCAATRESAEMAISKATPVVEAAAQTCAEKLSLRPRQSLESMERAMGLLEECVRGILSLPGDDRPISADAASGILRIPLGMPLDASVRASGPRAIAAVGACVELLAVALPLLPGLPGAGAFTTMVCSSLSSLCSLGLVPTPEQESRIPDDDVASLQESGRALQGTLGRCFAAMDGLGEECSAALTGTLHLGAECMGSLLGEVDSQWPGDAFYMWMSCLEEVAKGGGGNAGAATGLLCDVLVNALGRDPREQESMGRTLALASSIASVMSSGPTRPLHDADFVARVVETMHAASVSASAFSRSLLRQVACVLFHACQGSGVSSRAGASAQRWLSEGGLSPAADVPAWVVGACAVMAAHAAEGSGSAIIDSLEELALLSANASVAGAASQALAVQLLHSKAPDRAEALGRICSFLSKTDVSARAAQVVGVVGAVLGAAGAEGWEVCLDTLVEGARAAVADSVGCRRAQSTLGALEIMFRAQGGLLAIGTATPGAFLWRQRMISALLAKVGAAGRTDRACALSAVCGLAGCRVEHVKAEAKRAWPFLVSGTAAIICDGSTASEAEVLDLLGIIDEKWPRKGDLGFGVVLRGALSHIQAIIADKGLRETVVVAADARVGMDHLAACLLQAASYKPSWAVRALALESLRLLADGAQASNLWHRVSGVQRATVKGILASLDDNAREVRQSAIRARVAWELE